MDRRLQQAPRRINEKWFTYSGQSAENIPRNVTNVNVVIDPSVRMIGEGSFENCYSLICAVIPWSIKRIGPRAYLHCHRLKEIHLSHGLQVIGDDAFRNCLSLTKITLPPGLLSIGRSAFQNCWRLKKVSIPSTVVRIHESAFAGCENLADLEFVEGLKTIYDSAFESCLALTAVVLPSTTQWVGKKAFYGCTTLQAVETPLKIEELHIYGECFGGCENLVNISVPAGFLPEFLLAEDAFVGCSSLSTGIDPPVHSSITHRFQHLPAHKLCYYSSAAGTDELFGIAHTASNDDLVRDVYGMTPFHLLATSAAPRVDLLVWLVDRYPEEVLGLRDNHGNTMMNYLLDNGSSKSVVVLKMTLQMTIMDKLVEWGLDEELKSDLESSLNLIRCEDDPGTRRNSVRHFFGLVGQWARHEMTSLLELALWKAAINRGPKQDNQDDPSHREACRLHSGADIVIENVAGFLWGQDEPRAYTALWLFPAWCAMDPNDTAVLNTEDFDSEYENESLTDSELSFDSSVSENYEVLVEELAEMAREA